MPDSLVMGRVKTDITIVGGGLVGACLAIALARLSYRVHVIEAFDKGDQQQPSFDDRSVAISYGSVLILEQLGIWSELLPHACPIQEIQVSEQGRFGLTRMQSQEEGLSALGYVVENRVLGQVLMSMLEGLKEKHDLNWLAPAKVSEIRPLANCVEIDYTHQDAERTLQSQLVLAADGIHSVVRKSLNLPIEEKDYDIYALITNIQTQLPHHGRAFERFTASGPLAFLPLNDFDHQHRSSVVLSLKKQEVEEWESMDEATFLIALQGRFGFRLGKLLKTGERHIYPVPLIHTKQCTAHRVIMLGNAAQSLNPVAGQGFNLALRDVATLVGILNQSEDSDPGAASLLETYESQRTQDRQRTILFTDSLVTTFSNQFTLLSHLRAGGLMATDLIPMFRNVFARQGMGLSGRYLIKGQK